MRTVVIIGGALLLGLILSVQQDAPSDLVGPGDRVLLVGDSLAVGLVMPLRLLAKDSGIAFHGVGDTGSRTDQWAQDRLAKLLISFKPSVVLVCLGTNDMRMADPSGQKAHIQSILGQIRVAGAFGIWIMPPTMPFPDKGIRDMILSSGAAIVRADRLSLERAADGVHMTGSGYKTFAEAVWRCITSGTCP